MGIWVVLAGLVVVSAANAEDSFQPSSRYVVRTDHWSAADEQGYGAFVQAIGESSCSTLDACLHSDANPFRASDPADHKFESDCADLPYVLRFYYAWKRGLPFSYVSVVAPAGGESPDIRYSRHGNNVTARTDVRSGVMSGYAILDKIRADVSSATYRVHPDSDGPPEQDFYSPALDPKSIRPGTVIYDPAGHLAIVFRVDPNGRVHFFDAHTDFSLTQMVYDLRFTRARPADGAGFKNWRPIRLVGAKRLADGTLDGGHIVAASNKEISDFSDEQYYGNGVRPADESWDDATFTLKGERLDYYDYVRAQLAGGQLVFDPLDEISEMVNSICSNLQYRAQAVDLAQSVGMEKRPEPERLPRNIYGTDGDWEMYSTPSRDARLKTAFKALRDETQRFLEMHDKGDPGHHLNYSGIDLVQDMLAMYSRTNARCELAYTKSDASTVALSYEEARKRLFAMSFDPYQCPERRWGASDPAELASCRDNSVKQEWYAAEQNLRNQLDRTYDARMDFTLKELQTPGPGKGAATAPDTDVGAYLAGARDAEQAKPAQPVSASAP